MTAIRANSLHLVPVPLNPVKRNTIHVTSSIPESAQIANQQRASSINTVAFNAGIFSNSKRLSNRTIDLFDMESDSRSSYGNLGENEDAIELSSDYFEYPTRSTMRIRCPICSAYFQCSRPVISRSVSLYSCMIPGCLAQGVDSQYRSHGDMGTNSVRSVEREFNLRHESTNLVDDSPPREDSPTLGGNILVQPTTTQLRGGSLADPAPLTEANLRQAAKQILQTEAPMSHVQPKQGLGVFEFLKGTMKKDKGKEVLTQKEMGEPAHVEEALSATKSSPPRIPTPPRPGPEHPLPSETAQHEYSERVRHDPSHPELQKAAKVLGEEVYMLQAGRDAPIMSRRARLWRRLVTGRRVRRD